MIANFTYTATEIETLARIARDLGWTLRFIGISFGEWGIYFVARRRASKGER